MKKMRMLVAAVAAVAGLVAFAGPAQADPPNAVPGTSFPDPLPASINPNGSNNPDGFCPFPVHVDYLSNQIAHRSTTNPDGSTSTRFTGWATAIVTNLTTKKALKFKVSGPGTFTSFPDGAFNLNLGGANLLWTTVANSYPGVPQLAYTTGHVQVSVNAAGLTTSYKLNGNGGAPTDVCALLG
jgi:hypothetical protein